MIKIGVQVIPFIIFAILYIVGKILWRRKISGWPDLAKLYRHEDSFVGEKFMATASLYALRSVPVVEYMMWVASNPQGLFFVGTMPLWGWAFSPIFVPWKDISIKDQSVKGEKIFVKLQFDRVPQVTLSLDIYEESWKKILEKNKERLSDHPRQYTIKQDAAKSQQNSLFGRFSSLNWHPKTQYFAISILLLTGVYCAIAGMNNLNRAKASSAWSFTNGRIVSSELKKYRKGPGYYPSVQYQYVVNGTPYSSGQISLGDEFDMFAGSSAEQVVATYPVKKEIKVFYDPKDPRFSTLETGVTFSAYNGFIISALAFIVAWVLWLMTGIYRKKGNN